MGGKADVPVPVVRYEKFFGRGAGQRSRTRKGHRTNILCLLFNNPQEECSGILSGLPRTVPELKLSCLLLHCTRSEAIFFLVCQERFRNLNFNDNSSPALDLRQFFSGLPRTVPELKLLCLLLHCTRLEAIFFSGLPRTVPELKLLCLLFHCTRPEAIFFPC